MTLITRRDILAAVGSLSAVASAPGLAQPAKPVIDLSAGEAIGRAYLAAHPGVRLADLHRRHLPRGLDRTAIARLRSRAASDFRSGRIFVHDGWRLSETEAQLFALLGPLSPR